jgi:glucose-1-phosphate thymidylyltransferase
MKAIILAGGSGSRLQPMTNTISKQILPVYDKPMIFYPLSVIMELGLREILIISSPRDLPAIKTLLGDGAKYGISLSYAEQNEPKGIAEAFIVGADFVGDSECCLILGDNIFYGSDIFGDQLNHQFEEAIKLKSGAYIMAYEVSDPERYGVVELKKNSNTAISIEEKPKQPKSNWAVTGLYFYDNKVVEIAKNLKPSARGELEITDVNKAYLENGNLKVIKTGRGFAWLDAGTPESLLDSANFVHTIEKRQGIKISCIEEIAYRKGFIDKAGFEKLIESYNNNSDYCKYLRKVL